MPYYYLVASFPPLVLDGTVPFPSSSLPSRCENLVTRDDLEDLERLAAGRPGEGRHPFFRRWAALETQLRNALAVKRAGALHQEARPFLREHEGFDVSVETAAALALAADDPLQRELSLDRFRWGLLDDMAAAQRFGPAALFAFALKLRLAERWQRMTEEAGRGVLEGIISQNLESASAGSLR